MTAVGCSWPKQGGRARSKGDGYILGPNREVEQGGVCVMSSASQEFECKATFSLGQGSRATMRSPIWASSPTPNVVSMDSLQQLLASFSSCSWCCSTRRTSTPPLATPILFSAFFSVAEVSEQHPHIHVIVLFVQVGQRQVEDMVFCGKDSTS